MSEKPKRKFELSIKISGDTFVDCCHALADIVDRADKEYSAGAKGRDPKMAMVTAGHSCSYVVELDHRPDMTHEKYVEALGKYLAERELQERRDAGE